GRGRRTPRPGADPRRRGRDRLPRGAAGSAPARGGARGPGAHLVRDRPRIRGAGRIGHALYRDHGDERQDDHDRAGGASPGNGGYDAAARRLQLGDHALLARTELGLLGDHNVANALAAALAVRRAGVTPAVIAEGLRSFRPLPHRLEPVRDVGGVHWVNDSKATNIASTVVAVEAMDRPFVLLLGGRHKGEPYTRLAPLLKDRCRLVIAYGEAGEL